MNLRTAALISGLALCALAPAAARSPGPGQKLVGIGEVGDGNVGISVAVSARGDTAIVGGSGDAGDLGAAWPFRRVGGTWRQEDRKLMSGELDSTGFGLRVALSADGATALIGGPLANSGVGAAWIFTRTGTRWRERAKLTPKHEAGRSSFGESVALSADGSTALVGGPTDSLGAGAAWVFTRAGSAWKESARLAGRGEVGPGRLGASVALSADGRLALAGGPLDANDVGAVWVFARSGSAWREQGPKLALEHTKSQAQFGSSVALSAGGTTALIGAPIDDKDVGTAWVFRRSGATWKQQGKKLEPPGKPGTVQFGGSVSLSGSGSIAIVGASTNNGDVGTGAVWIFRQNGSSWSLAGGPLTGRGEQGRGGFGSSVAVSTDGSTALVGGYNDDGGTGAAWTFGL